MGASGGSRTTMSAAWQLLSGRANPPAILQRLFGPAQDHHMPIQISTNGGHYGHGTGGSSSAHHVTTTPRVLFANTMLDAPEDWFVDLYDENVPGSSSQRNAAGGSGTVPTAHSRWIEESRVLDGDSLHDCVALLKPHIIPHLEKLRDEELAQRKEKRKDKAKAAQDKKDSDATADEGNKSRGGDGEEAHRQQQTLSENTSAAAAVANSALAPAVQGSSSSNNSDNRQSSSGGSSRVAEDLQEMDMTIVIEPTQVHEEFAQNIVEGLLRPATAGEPTPVHSNTEPGSDGTRGRLSPEASATSGTFVTLIQYLIIRATSHRVILIRSLIR